MEKRREFEIRATGFFVYDGDNTEEQQLILLEEAGSHDQYIDGVQYTGDYEHHSAKTLLWNINVFATMLELAYTEGTKYGMIKGHDNLEAVIEQVFSPNIQHYKTFVINGVTHRTQKGVVQMGDHYIRDGKEELYRGSGFTDEDWKVWWSNDPVINKHVMGKVPNNIKSYIEYKSINDED